MREILSDHCIPKWKHSAWEITVVSSYIYLAYYPDRTYFHKIIYCLAVFEEIERNKEVKDNDEFFTPPSSPPPIFLDHSPSKMDSDVYEVSLFS